MPLHYKLNLLLAIRRLRGDKSLHEFTPAEARKEEKKGWETFNNFINYPPEPLFEIKDFTIDANNGQIVLRMYKPLEKQSLPVCMFFHGGGFVVGDIETHDLLCRKLALLSKSIFVSVGYRLAPEHLYPTALEDCYKATKWVYENAQTWGGDAQKLALCGDSAGGNLATTVAMLLHNRQDTIKICQQILIYPALDATISSDAINTLADGYLLTRELLLWFYEQYLPLDADRTNAYISPIYAKDLSFMPPTLLITAEYDPLKDEGAKYAQKLTQAGVPVVHTHYLTMMHLFVQMPKFLKQARQAQQQIADTLQKAFGN